MRLFFAVNLPPHVLDHVVEVRDAVRAALGEDGIRWLQADQFHYTLKFLGELPPRRAHGAAEAVQQLAKDVRPFSLTLGGVGAFPNPQRASVVWLGAAEGAEPLVALAERLDRTLAGRGFRRERQPLKPHLTIARIKGYAGETSVARRLPELEINRIATFTVESIALMQSVLSPAGSTYSLVETFPLSAE